ncbi:unnamed protein product [Rotaria sp. Silwood1]|nr:unnamed protein product [Rotaria sp. Silwood1]
MHEDGLHQSIISGRNLIERAIYNWFSKQKRIHSSSIQLNTCSIKPISNTNININQVNHNYHHTTNTNSNTHQHHHHPTTTTTNINNNHYHHINHNHNHNHHHHLYHTNNNKMKQPSTHNIQEKLHDLPSKSLIPHYPHFLRHKQEFFRKITIPIELENKKEDIYNLSNIHYQTEYYKFESEKWKVYTIAANKKKQIELMDTIIEVNESLPVARPSPTGLARPPAALELTEFSEFFDEWLSEPTPGQKRKLGYRRDDPPTPPSPRQPPPIIPRKILPPRNPNIPLVGGSLQTSPISIDIENKISRKQQHSFNSLLPIEQQRNQNEQQTIKTPNIVVLPESEPSMIISPIRSSTPEPIIKSPSVIPKNSVTPYSSFKFSIIPIEYKYYFKQMRKKCTFETIKAHQEFLENKYKTLENERENKLHLSFPEQMRTQVVSFVKKILEKTLENKKNNDQKQLDNLLLNQTREKAIREINDIATESEQQCIQALHEKFTRTLDLKLQLDKLEMRFTENMPPPSLNIFDKLQLHAKGLKSDDKSLTSLREQWKNVLRKTKLDLTTLMRQAKVVELEQAKKEYEELIQKLLDQAREPYNIICQGVHNQRKLMHALAHSHPKYSKAKLHPHYTRINFPPQANNKAYILQDTEAKVLNLGPKFVPPAPEQVLERLPKEIENMKEKVAAAWRRKTKTIAREPPIVTKFCERIEEEIRKKITTEAPRDPTLKPAITFFRKVQKKNNIIFRQTDKSKVFHTDTKENYIKKSTIYMDKTNAYVEISSPPLREMIEKTDKFLRNLVSRKRIPQALLEKLRPSLTESELPYLYYNPKDHKIGEPLRPIVSGMKSP